MIENIRLSFQSIFAHKMRSILTMLGVIIGIMAIIVIVSLIEGLSERTKQEMIGGGANTIAVMFQPKENNDGGTPPPDLPPINEDKLQQIRDQELVKNISVFFENQAEGFYLNKPSYPMIRGIDSTYFDLFPTQLVSGRMLTSSELTSQKNVAMINEVMQNELFPGEDAVGKIIEIQSVPFRVAGVYKKKGDDSSMMFEEWSQPEMFVSKNIWPMLYGFGNSPNILVQAHKADDLQDAGMTASSILNQDLPENTDWGYSIPNMKEIMEQLKELNRVFMLLLGGIASISLLVGGIGVMNIMLVSVTERTREIGIKKALGAPRSVILFQFITESAVLTSMGGIIGILLGLGISKAVSYFISFPFVISMPAIIGSVLFSMFVGILFGLLPSIKASRMNPIEALSHE